MSGSEIEKESDNIIKGYDKIKESVEGEGKRWNKFRGDALERIVAHYLEKHLPENATLRRSCFIEGHSKEFDILIIKKKAAPRRFTGAYPKEKVYLGIEVKASGIFWPYNETDNKLKEKFSRTEAGKPYLYLSISESKKRAEKTFNTLDKDKNTVFILKIRRKGKRVGEWERFVNRVREVIGG